MATMARGMPSSAYLLLLHTTDNQRSSFSLKLGSRDTKVRVFPSTKASALWAVSPFGCMEGYYPAGLPCNASGDVVATGSRGGIFDWEDSSTWQNNTLQSQPFYYLHADEKLVNDTSEIWGYDTISLGDSGPTLTNQTIAAISNNQFWLGVFPLNPRPSNFSVNSTDYLAPSLLEALKGGGYIPSLSWGYTAGARYGTQWSIFHISNHLIT